MVPGQSINTQYLPSPLSDAITNLFKTKLHQIVIQNPSFCYLEY